MSSRRSRKLPLEQLRPYLFDASACAGPIHLAELFGNSNSVEVEVGFGKGLFLLAAAQSRPDVNFLGIEIERKYQLFTANRIAKRHLSNVRLAQADARLFFRNRLADNCLQAVHVYFPDPWWKRRHHKRRLFTPEFAHESARVLRPGGRLLVATDVKDYFAIITSLLADAPALAPLPSPEAPAPAHDMDYLTNFERKFRQAGDPIFRAVYEKKMIQ